MELFRDTQGLSVCLPYSICTNLEQWNDFAMHVVVMVHSVHFELNILLMASNLSVPCI